jgi:hypothetical protein
MPNWPGEDKSRQVIDSKNVLEAEAYGGPDQCRRFRLSFRQSKIDFDTNRIVCGLSAYFR